MRFWLVNVSVWLSVACWFTGVLLFLTGRKRSSAGSRVWMVGVSLMVVHTVSSYGFVHDWSHQAALRFTGDQSESVTGIRAEWGLYANFFFILIWLHLAFQWRPRFERRSSGHFVMLGFLATIVFFATIVFEDGWIRIGSLAGFLGLAVFGARKLNRRHA